jgi:hypothetical protein
MEFGAPFSQRLRHYWCGFHSIDLPSLRFECTKDRWLMKTKQMILIICAALPLAGCATYEGGTAEETGTAGTLGSGAGEAHPEPAASPTFRPGMNPSDPRDPHFTIRPQPAPAAETTPAQP